MPARSAYRSPSRPRPGIACAVVICRMGASARSAIAMASTLAVSMRARCAGLRPIGAQRRVEGGDDVPLLHREIGGRSPQQRRNSVGSARRRTANRTSAQPSVPWTRAFRRGRLSSTRATEIAMHGRSGLGRRLAPQATYAIARRRPGDRPHAVAPRQVESPRPRTSRPGMNQRSAAPLCREKVLRRACPTVARDQVG